MESSRLLKKKLSTDFALEIDDILQNILSKLPAVSFASAACVSRSWNAVCDRVLSRPKLATAISISCSLQDAVDEVLKEVLSKPIRLHFAIAYVLKFDLEATHQLMTNKLGFGIPIITNDAAGLMARHGATDTLKHGRLVEDHNAPAAATGTMHNTDSFMQSYSDDCAIVLVVGYVPGLKVDTIPLLRPKNDDDTSWQSYHLVPKMKMLGKFLKDIKDYTASVSDCTSPDAIIMFGEEHVDMKPVLVQMDNNMTKETVIVGESSGRFLFYSGDNSRNSFGNSYYIDAVALVFAKDKLSPHAAGGKIQFHITQSNGLLPFGPKLKVTYVTAEESGESSLLSARVEGQPRILDTSELFQDIYQEVDATADLYIGVTHRKESLVGSQQLGSRLYLAYYKVLLGSQGQFSFEIEGVGIKPGDSFILYHTDTDTALQSSVDVFEELEKLKPAEASSSEDGSSSSSWRDPREREIFGGLLFSWSSPTYPSPFGRYFVETLPFTSCFPGVPVASICGRGEIARVSTSLIEDEEEGEESSDSGACFLHHNNTAYLTMSHNPTPQAP